MTASLIITTFNWPEALAAVLYSVKGQTTPPDEIIIADDGSERQTATTIKKILSSDCPFSWKHIRHNNKGIRQARIKNLAVKHSFGEYLIFIDHDVLLHQNFIQDHKQAAETGVFLQGKRTFLPKQLTQKILTTPNHIRKISLLTNGLENKKNIIRSSILAKLFSFKKNSFQKTLRGCNFSLFKDNFISVDGYDEFFDQAWGREDSDICYRLFHNDIKIKNLWFSAIQMHIHHKSIKNRNKDMLDKELEKIIKEKRTKAKLGYSCLSPEGEIISCYNP